MKISRSSYTAEFKELAVKRVKAGVLGRAVQTQADSEQGKLTTTVEYLGSFQKRVTNPRQYVYDGYQRLCKTIEPEIGVMKQKFDDANSILWRVSGITGTLLDTWGEDYATSAEKVSSLLLRGRHQWICSINLLKG